MDPVISTFPKILYTHDVMDALKVSNLLDLMSAQVKDFNVRFTCWRVRVEAISVRVRCSLSSQVPTDYQLDTIQSKLPLLLSML